MAQYWLLDWLDTQGVKSVADAARVLETPAGKTSLSERAVLQAGQSIDLPEARGQIVAGTGMDLSGQLACGAFECMTKTVDTLLRRSWHYFDGVVVTGLDPVRCHTILSHPRKFSMAALQAHISLALHVREIGAEDLLLFSRYPGYCTDHLEQHAAQAGMPPVATMVNGLQSALLSDYHVDISQLSDGWYASLRSAITDFATFKHFEDQPVQGDALAYELALDDAQFATSLLIRNVALSKLLSASLGQVTQLAESMHATPFKAASATETAFSLPLPILENVPIKEILAFRRDAASEFVVFRSALRTAVKEQVAALPGGTAQDVADSVLDDIIQPALAKIHRKTVGAAEVLARRSAVSVGVGTAVATVGLLAFAPLAIAGVTLGAAGVIATANDYLKEKRDVDQDDMHFLWQLTREQMRH